MGYVSGLAYVAQDRLPHNWCSGCGNGIVLGAISRAFETLNLKPNEIVVTTGIGCWGKADDYFATSALHGTHGRALSFATGVKAVNPELTVVTLMGDGDGATIGGNHLVHAARRNMDLTAIVVNNYNYGMTGGQYSATTPQGKRTSTSHLGNPERELDVCSVVAASGANYVARSTAYHVTALEKLIVQAIEKKGFSFVEIISPCPTQYGRRNAMKIPVESMKYLKDNAVPINKYQQLEDLDSSLIATGVLVDKSAPDFTSQYENIRSKVLGKKEKR